MGKCEYLNCTSLTRRVKRNKGSNLSFFRFPRDTELCKKWIESCQRECLFDIGVERLHRSHVICGVHFKDFDFVNPLTKKKLRNGAVPSQHSLSTVPKADFISSFGHYVVRNRHEKETNFKSTSESTICFGSLEIGRENKMDESDTVQKEIPSYLNEDEYGSRDLACLKTLSNISQNLENLLPPISPPEASSSMDCSASNEVENISLMGLSVASSFVRSEAVTVPTGSVLVTSLPEKQEKSLGAERLCNVNGQGISGLANSIISNPNGHEETALILDNNNLKDLTYLSPYKQLTNLSMMDNKICELHWFECLPNLKSLNLRQNCISSVKDLHNLGHLSHIDLSNNLIKDLEFVPLPNSTWGNLLTLNLSGNKISKLVDLTMCSNLQVLNLADNFIKSLKLFGTYLPNSITELLLEENYIRELLDFNQLTKLENLKVISVKNNPCFSVYIQKIDANNKLVTVSPSLYFIPFLVSKCLHLAVIDGNDVTSSERSIAQCLNNDSEFFRCEANDSNELISYLARSCIKTENKPLTTEKESRSWALSSSSTAGSPRISYERNNQECFSASCSRNKTAIEENSRHNYVKLIEEKACNYKLKRVNESLLEKIQFLENILSDNGLNISNINVKLEEEDVS